MMIANKGTQSLEPAIPLYVTRDWTPEKAGGKPPFHLAQDRSTLGTPSREAEERRSESCSKTKRRSPYTEEGAPLTLDRMQ